MLVLIPISKHISLKYKVLFVEIVEKMLQNTLFYFLVISIIDVQMVSIERNENYVVNEKVHERLLSRKRRYLTFPEGSSMQLGELAAYFSRLMNSNRFLMCFLCVC